MKHWPKDVHALGIISKQQPFRCSHVALVLEWAVECVSTARAMQTGCYATRGAACVQPCTACQVPYGPALMQCIHTLALQVDWLTVACSRCIFSDCKDTPVMESQMVGAGQPIPATLFDSRHNECNQG
jgi:hypothetical protein